MWMLTAVLFVTAPNWKQPKQSLREQYVDKWWDSHTMKYHLAMKTSGFLIHPTTWMNVTCLTLSERRQTQACTLNDSIWHFGNGETMGTENDQCLPSIWEEGKDSDDLSDLHTCPASLGRFRDLLSKEYNAKRGSCPLNQKTLQL